MTEVRMTDLSEDLRKLGNGFQRLSYEDTSVSVRYKRGTGSTLVVIFHGAVDQKTRSIPHHQSLLPGIDEAHQLSISDPTLELHSDIMSGWYLGGENSLLQGALSKMISRVSRLIGAHKRIYVGGSSGGFAALYYSWADPGSACVAVNPQVNLNAYLPKATDIYLKNAWKNAKTLADIDGVCDIDVSLLYRKSFHSTVIYIQSAGDNRHFSEQLSEFIDVGLKHPDKFILNTGYWGIPGHSGSAPPSSYYPWVKSLTAAEDFDKQKILDAYHIISESSKTRPLAVASPKGDKALDPDDIKMADYLRDYHLRSSVD